LAAKKLAEETMVNKESKIDYARAQAEMAVAIAQLQAIARLRKK
jgi:F-type H+-transporting ATPase subunit epsilon